MPRKEELSTSSRASQPPNQANHGGSASGAHAQARRRSPPVPAATARVRRGQRGDGLSQLDGHSTPNRIIIMCAIKAEIQQLKSHLARIHECEVPALCRCPRDDIVLLYYVREAPVSWRARQHVPPEWRWVGGDEQQSCTRICDQHSCVQKQPVQLCFVSAHFPRRGHTIAAWPLPHIHDNGPARAQT